MIAAFSLLLHLGILIIRIHIKAILFLIRRFEITNGLIAGFTFQMLTGKLNMNIWVRVAIIICIVVASILLQYFFKAARVLFGVIGSVFVGFIAYAVFQDNLYFSPYIPMIIAIILSGIVNILGWKLRQFFGTKDLESE